MHVSFSQEKRSYAFFVFHESIKLIRFSLAAALPLLRRGKQIANLKSLGKVAAQAKLSAQVELIDRHQTARHCQQVVEAAMDVCFRVIGRGRQDLHAAVREADLECSRTAPDDCDLHHAVVSTVVTAAVYAFVFHVTVAELVKCILKGNRRARACAAADIFIHAVILLCALVPRKTFFMQRARSLSNIASLPKYSLTASEIARYKSFA